MSKYAFVGDIVHIDQHLYGAFICQRSEDTSEEQLYRIVRNIVKSLEKERNIVACIAPIEYHSEEELEHLDKMISDTPSVIDLMEHIDMDVDAFIFVNPSYAFDPHIKEVSTVGIACSAEGLARQIAEIAKDGAGGVLFSPMGKKMLGAVVYNPREFGQLELQIGPIPSENEIITNSNLFMRFPADVFENDEKESEWIKAMGKTLEEYYGKTVISYPVPEECL